MAIKCKYEILGVEQMKNIYSLVLNSEIINLIDNVAYKKGVSRSTLVNQILADYVGYETDEQRLSNMFSLIDQIIESEQRMRLLSQNSASGFSIVSALNYKYSPRVTYSVDLNFDERYLGELNISCRTSKPELIDVISEFFSEIIKLEGKFLPYNVKYSLIDGKLKRKLVNTGVAKTANDVASLLTSYVKMLDELLNLYILDDVGLRKRNLEKRFLAQAVNGKI